MDVILYEEFPQFRIVLYYIAETFEKRRLSLKWGVFMLHQQVQMIGAGICWVHVREGLWHCCGMIMCTNPLVTVSLGWNAMWLCLEKWPILFSCSGKSRAALLSQWSYNYTWSNTHYWQLCFSLFKAAVKKFFRAQKKMQKSNQEMGKNSWNTSDLT